MRSIKTFLLSLLLVIVPNLAFTKEVNLLTSIKPLQLIAAAIQKDIGNPDVLLPVGVSPHHYALRPADIQKIQGAALFYSSTSRGLGDVYKRQGLALIWRFF